MSQSDRTSRDELLQSAFQHAAVGMALVGPEGNWLTVNSAICQIVGYSEEELLATTFQKITHPDDLDLDLELLQQLSSGAIPHYRLEKRYIHKDGRTIWVHLSVSAVRKESGEVDFYISQIEDITARKNLETNLRVALEEREHLIRQLEASLKQNQALRDKLVTICAWTNRIFHDGRWMSTNEFLGDYLGLNLTHGISEEGKALFYSDATEAPELPLSPPSQREG
jgi:PAS domain S-box-containing protein